LPDYKEMYFN